jgi:hypothetical protein
MCDYSLGGIPSRLAREGEELVTHRFVTGSIGLASVADLEPKPQLNWWRRLFYSAPALCAVCMPPGARLKISAVTSHGVLSESFCGVEGTFTQIHPEAYSYRDAIVFDTWGRRYLLQTLGAGIRLHVVSLAASETRQTHPEEVIGTGMAAAFYDE